MTQRHSKQSVKWRRTRQRNIVKAALLLRIHLSWKPELIPAPKHVLSATGRQMSEWEYDLLRKNVVRSVSQAELTVAEIAQRNGVSVRTVARWARQAKLPPRTGHEVKRESRW